MKSLVNAIESSSEVSTGTPFIWVELVEYLKNDLFFGSIVVFAVLVLIVSIDFKDIKSIIYVMTPVTIGVSLLIGTMVLFGIKFNAANIAAIPLIIGIGVDDGIHLIHKYRNRGIEDVAFVLASTGKSVMITSFTTMIGFGSLYFIKDPLISGLGVLLFFGVFYCLITSLTLLPIIMYFDNKKHENAVKEKTLQ